MTSIKLDDASVVHKERKSPIQFNSSTCIRSSISKLKEAYEKNKNPVAICGIISEIIQHKAHRRFIVCQDENQGSNFKCSVYPDSAILGKDPLDSLLKELHSEIKEQKGISNGHLMHPFNADINPRITNELKLQHYLLQYFTDVQNSYTNFQVGDVIYCILVLRRFDNGEFHLYQNNKNHKIIKVQKNPKDFLKRWNEQCEETENVVNVL